MSKMEAVPLDEITRLRNIEMTILRTHAALFPEKYPPGHALHDPEHVYWEGSDPLMLVTRESLFVLNDEELCEQADELLPDFEWPEEPEEIGPLLDDNERDALVNRLLAERDKYEAEPYEWDSGTIEWVAGDIESALQGHPLFNG